MDAVRWAIVVAAALHVVEEWRGDWVGWARRHVPGVTPAQFWTLNAAFLALCLAGARAGAERPVFSLSVAALVSVNALVHLVPALRSRRYTPGLWSAVLLYLPLGSAAFALALRTGEVAGAGAVRAGFLGLGWMAVPGVFQAVRLALGSRRGT